MPQNGLESGFTPIESNTEIQKELSALPQPAAPSLPSNGQSAEQIASSDVNTSKRQKCEGGREFIGPDGTVWREYTDSDGEVWVEFTV